MLVNDKEKRMLSIRKMALLFALMTGLAGSVAPSFAASSFTSIAQAMTDGSAHRFGPFTAYGGGKLISEDDRNFTLDAFGCRFDVQAAPTGWPGTGMLFGAALMVGGNPTFSGRLGNARPANIVDDVPHEFVCAPNVSYFIFLERALDRHNGEHLLTTIAMVFPSRTKGREVIDAQYRFYRMDMRKDIFTPKQWDQAKHLGMVSLGIFEALLPKL
jgi:hypothetical protein